MRFNVKILVIITLLLSCRTEISNKDKDEIIAKQIEVDFNPNIHTSHIVEMFVWPGEYPTRPMCVAAQKYFEPFKDHPAIVLSDSLLQNEIFYFDELTEILLYLDDFPSTEFKHSLESSPYANREEIINEWIKRLSEFYVDANVESFLRENETFYEGARQEVIKNLPPEDFVYQMEEYYRESKIEYTIIPAPEMPTGGAFGYRGIGPYVYTSNGMLIYQVISASLPVEKDSISKNYQYFGFDKQEFILRNSYHEFGHAFVNPILAKRANKILLDSYKHLFTPELQKVMDAQNYDNWFDCMAEHIVRLGEIRLADRSGNQKWANELRAYHTDELNFIFLPELETKVKEYESDDSFKSFEQFLPNLLKVMDGFNSDIIKRRINKST